MQLQYAGHMIAPEDLSVYLNPGGDGHPFAVVSVSRLQVYLQTAEEADELIKVAVEAKRLLLGEPAPVITDSEPAAGPGGVLFPAGGGWCPAFTVLDDDETASCDRPAGHIDSHHAHVPGDTAEVAWSDEPASVTEPEDHPDTAGPTYGEAELRRADAYREPRAVSS